MLPILWENEFRAEGEERKAEGVTGEDSEGLVLCLKCVWNTSLSFSADFSPLIFYFFMFSLLLLIFFKKVKQPRQHFFYLATIYLPSCFCIHLSGKTVKGRKHGGFPRLISDILMRTFLWSKYQASRVPTITIGMITEASACCLTRFPPTGQWLSLELLVICHVEGSGIVPGPFQIVAMKLQWHDKTTAGEPTVYPWGSVSVFVFYFFLNQTTLYCIFFLCLSYRHMLGFPALPKSPLFMCLVNSVINHLATLTELLRPTRCCILDLTRCRQRFLLSNAE